MVFKLLRSTWYLSRCALFPFSCGREAGTLIMLARIILWIWLIAMAADVKASAFVPGSRLPCLQRLARDTRLCPGTPLSSERKIISPAALSRAMFRTEKKSPPPPPAPQQQQQKLQSPPPTPLQRVLSRSMLDITKPQHKLRAMRDAKNIRHALWVNPRTPWRLHPPLKPVLRPRAREGLLRSAVKYD